MDLAPSTHSLISDAERAAATTRRDALRAAHLVSRPDRAPSTGRGVHHVALICADVEATIDFYQGLLGFPLIEMFENRDLGGSTHFFFDIGHGNALAFFDLPGVDPGPYAEVLGGLHHLAIAVAPGPWAEIRARLDAAGVAYAIECETSMYLRDPDGARIELLADPLGEMYGDLIG
jgi:catechol 2,3-dioxygenase-like lactoylglutathione lyase family enzyme